MDYDGISPAVAASEVDCEATAQQILTYARPRLTVDYQLNTMMALKKEEEDAENSLSSQLSVTSDTLGSLIGSASKMLSFMGGAKETKETSNVMPFHN
jgi:hypothetical protein